MILQVLTGDKTMRTTLILVVSLFSTTLWAENISTPSGLWNTVDDTTGEVRSTVKVTVEKDRLFGTIMEVHDPLEKNPTCDKCKGELKDLPVIGMQVINGLTLKNDVWKRGTLFDPESGKEYKGEVWLEGEYLMVRGYVGFSTALNNGKRKSKIKTIKHLYGICAA